MNKSKFIQTVALYANPDDFRQNKKRLLEVDPNTYHGFIHLIQQGMTIESLTTQKLHGVRAIDLMIRYFFNPIGRVIHWIEN